MYINETLVSIIIPAYNAGNFIKRSVASAQSQTYRRLEIIVINDGSKDKTRECVEEMCEEDSRIKLINTENHGVSCARNTGIEHAVGEWIMFLDADDALLNDAVETLLRCAIEQNLDIVSAEYQSTQAGEWVAKNSSEAVSVYCGSQGVLRALEDRPETYSACAKLFKKSAIKNVRFPEGRKAHEDSFFVFCCLAKKPRFGVCDKTVYLYYSTPGSASRGEFSERLFDILILAEEKIRIVEKLFPEYADRARLMLLKANMSMLRNLLKTNEKTYREIENKCIKFIKKNSDCFQEAMPSEEKWLRIVKGGCYRPYKTLWRLKNRIRGD